MPARLDRLRDETQANATGFSQLSWLGATREEYLDEIARLNECHGGAPFELDIA